MDGLEMDFSKAFDGFEIATFSGSLTSVELNADSVGVDAEVARVDPLDEHYLLTVRPGTGNRLCDRNMATQYLSELVARMTRFAGDACVSHMFVLGGLESKGKRIQVTRSPAPAYGEAALVSASGEVEISDFCCGFGHISAIHLVVTANDSDLNRNITLLHGYPEKVLKVNEVLFQNNGGCIYLIGSLLHMHLYDPDMPGVDDAQLCVSMQGRDGLPLAIPRTPARTPQLQ